MSDPTSEAIRAELARLQTDNAQLSARIVHQRNLIEDADKVIKELESEKRDLGACLDEAFAALKKAVEILTKVLLVLFIIVLGFRLVLAFK